MGNSVAAPSLPDPMSGQDLGRSQYEFRTKPPKRFIIVFQFRHGITAEFRIILSYQNHYSLRTSSMKNSRTTYFFNLRSLSYVLLTVHLGIILDNDQLDTHLLYFTIRLL